MQIGGASATDIFGSPSVDSIFSAGQSTRTTAGQETARVAIEAQRREINRIRGYKVDLTPAEKQRLKAIQDDVVKIERKAAAGTVRQDELDDRLELLDEADRIIGKPVVDVEADETLAQYAQALNTLLAPKLAPPVARRVDVLERLKADIEERFNDNPKSSYLRARLQSVTRQINKLTTPRPVSRLSVTERKLYDDLAELINEHAGEKIQVSSKDAMRIAELERSIVQLQELLPADPGQQPTPQAVSRAYTRLQPVR